MCAIDIHSIQDELQSASSVGPAAIRYYTAQFPGTILPEFTESFHTGDLAVGRDADTLESDARGPRRGLAGGRLGERGREHQRAGERTGASTCTRVRDRRGATKAFTSHIAALALLASIPGGSRACPSEGGPELVCRLAQLPALVAQARRSSPRVKPLGGAGMAEASNGALPGRVEPTVALEGLLS